MCWKAVCASLDSVLDLHSDVMDSTCASGVTRIEVRMRVWRRRVLAAEAKKAGSARKKTLSVCLYHPSLRVVRPVSIAYHLEIRSGSFPVPGVVSYRRSPNQGVCR